MSRPPITGAIVIPAFEEGSRLGKVLARVPSEVPGLDRLRLIVVDDGSQDNTASVARNAGAIVVRHAVNLGQGGSLRTGTEAALRLGADIVIHMDADGQHPPEDLPRLVAALLAGADAVSGVRSFQRPMPWMFILGNQGLAVITRRLFGVSNPDTQCGYRAFWARSWPGIRWDSPDYAFASEMLVRSERHGIRWHLIPIQTIYLDRYKGTGIADGVRILQKLVGWRLSQ